MLCVVCGHANSPDREACFGCGRNLSGIVKGTVLCGRYEILDRLGRGGMGTVYSARDRELDDVVALKVLRRDLGNSPDFIARFRREIRLARRVRHNNVCAVHEYAQDGPHRFMVMEYVDGTDLKALIQREGVPRLLDAVAMVKDLGAGLQAIHDAGIVHRDLKTANVMRTPQGRVRLMDFGIARQFEAGTPGVTVAGQIVGTPQYMSPEQIEAKDLDPRSDVYALGIVFYELLTGTPPFTGDEGHVLSCHLHVDPPLEGRIPQAVVPVIERAVRKRREARFDSARAFVQALTDVESTMLVPFAGTTVSSTRPIFTATAPALDLQPRPDTESVPTDVVNAANTEAGTSTATRQFDRHARTSLVVAVTTLAVGAAAWNVSWRDGSTPPAPVVPSPAAPALAIVSPEPVRPVPQGPPASLITEPRQDARLARQGRTGPAATAPREPPRGNPPPTVAREPEPERAREAPVPVHVQSLVEEEKPIAVQAPAEPGRLTLAVRPWAEVTLDGRNLGTTPLSPISVPPGEYVLIFTNPRYPPVRRTIRVSAGESIAVEVDLRR